MSKIKDIEVLKEMEKEGHIKLIDTTGPKNPFATKETPVWCISKPVGEPPWRFTFKGNSYGIRHTPGLWHPFVYRIKGSVK